MGSSGQYRDSCEHIMAVFELHDKCAGGRISGLSTDQCVIGVAV